MRCWRVCSSIRTSSTARSSSAWVTARSPHSSRIDRSFQTAPWEKPTWPDDAIASDGSCVLLAPRGHAGRVDHPWDGHDLVAAHHERPRLALGTGDLRVDEHVLDLPAAACEAVARPPRSYLKAWPLGLDDPLPPTDGSFKRHRAALEPQPVVLAHRLEAAAQVEPLRPGRRREQLREGRRERGALLQRPEQVRVRGRVQAAEQRQDLVADEAALRVCVGRVDAEL